jgi:alpha-beta hydrolase superfamily lysophospholipase
VTHATGFFAGAGGLRIFWQSWRPRGEATAVVVLVHGASEHSGRYAHVAEALTSGGYAVYALDHRGHGRSGGTRAVLDRMSHAVADLDQLVLRAREENLGRPVFMLGHSMGGTVAVSYCLRHKPGDSRLAGLILSGPLAALEAAPAPLLALGRMLSVLAPRLGVVAIDANLVSRDPQVVRDYVADPLNHHGRLPARTVAELAAAVGRFPDAVPAITLPALILYGTADALAPPAGSEMLLQRLGSADKRATAYPGLFHEILNEPEREEVLTEILGWLSAHAPGASAGSASTDAAPAERTTS